MTDQAPQPIQSEVQQVTRVRINAPAWFQRADFICFLKHPRVAAWHDKTSDRPDEYSDVFMTYDCGDGSNSPAFVEGQLNDCVPVDICQEIARICQQAGITEALIWITNLKED